MNTTGFGSRIADAQQAVGVRRGGRHDHRQPGDVGEQRLKRLGVLAARGPPAAELRPDHQAHARLAAGHEPQLGGLVEYLVEADAEEVEVHQLDDRGHARHRAADREPHHRGLRDRRVEQPVRPFRVQAAGEGEHVAALADVDAGHEHVGIRRELAFEREPHRVHRAEDLAVGVGPPGGLRDRRARGVHRRAEHGHVRPRRLPGGVDRGVDPGPHLGLDLVERGRRVPRARAAAPG